MIPQGRVSCVPSHFFESARSDFVIIAVKPILFKT